MLHEVAFLDCDISDMRICGANTIWMVDAHIERSADLAGKADIARRSRHHWRIWLSFVFPAPIARRADVRWTAKPINYSSGNWLYISPALIVFPLPVAFAEIAFKITCF